MSKKGYKIRFVTNDDIYMKDRITQGITNIKDNEYDIYIYKDGVDKISFSFENLVSLLTN